MEIRDNRDKQWFWLDNEYLNGYAKHLGPTASLVYISLCRHADNNTQKCFPSMELMAEELGMQRAAISRAIKKLQEWKIVEVKSSFDKVNKKRKNNVYTLTKKTMWRDKPCNFKLHGNEESHVTLKSKPCNFDDESHVTQSYNNNTHNNNTHITISEDKSSQDIVAVIDGFLKINTAAKKWYGNKTQRASAKRLVDSHGLDKVLRVISILPKTNITTYLPSVHTVLQLEDKWSQLATGLQKKQIELKEKNKTVGIIQ